MRAMEARVNNERTKIRKAPDHDTEQLVFDFEGAFLRGSVSDTIFGTIEEQQAAGRTQEGGATGENSVLADIRGTDEGNSLGLHSESQSTEIGGNNSQRNSYGYSYLQPANNYRLTDENFENRGGAKTRYKNNISAIKLIYELERTQAPATREQQDILAKYVGWGGLSQAFDEHNGQWQKEYAELKELLSPADYKLAKESVLSSFYTSKTVIDGIYEGLRQLGFDGGTILEPAMGTGNFVGLLPDDMKSKVYGIELDNITGKIAQHLYPQANVKISGFEKVEYPDNFFDSVITNVPFGAFKVFDENNKAYKDFFIHDYFILKSLDKLRPGGVAAVVTTKGTMDKTSSFVRECFAEKAELLGAIRLPNNAFKDTSNTEVTSDILFFKKKRELVSDNTENWFNVSEDNNGVPLNDYYVTNPEMVLGKMSKGKSMYGSEDETYCEPDGRDLKAALSEAVKHLPKNIFEARAGDFSDAPRLIAEEFKTKNYCHEVIDGKIYLRVDSELIPQYFTYANAPRMRSMIELRKQVRHLLDIQINGCDDSELESEQQKLNRLYDSFVRRHGAINSKSNKTLFRDDADFTLLLSLENYDEVTGAAKKTDIFSKRTIRKYTRPEKADTALEALYISKNETGKVNLRIIEQLTGKELVDIITELNEHIYRNPNTLNIDDDYSGWETAAEYLSGNVRQKLTAAQAAVQHFPELEKNVQALVKVQPLPLSASEISVRLGVSWIRPEIYKQFIIEKFKLGWYDRDRLQIDFNNYSLEWKVDATAIRTFESSNTFGTKRVNGFKLAEYALNLQTPSVYDTVEDQNGKEKRVLNKPETIAAREKMRKIQEEFKSWIFDEPERRNELVNIYNEKFNNIVLTKYDGSYLQFPEMNPHVELKDYQKSAVDRIITSGNTLLHHVVGAGKTFEIAAAAMKLRQLKLAQKPMIVVPNHLTLQWANEFRTLYPNAKLLIATKKDFTKENRLQFISRIATGDWDAIVIAMSSFEKLPISKERQEKKLNEEIGNIEAALNEMRHDRDKRLTVKGMQKILKNKEAQLQELSSAKKDDLIKFEELGVDYLFVDEAHKFKNKFIFTKMNNVAGISRAMSKRSTDLDNKIDYISELHGGQKGVVFATGTPISNSMVEMYTMQSYLQKNDLLKAGLRFFDDWAATFGETQTVLELAPSGQGYRSKTRFAKFVNLPELLKIYHSFADVKTADMLNLPVPKANKHVINIKPTDEILMLNEQITERAERIYCGGVDPQEDNMLKVTSDGKKLALDPRCFEPSSIDDAGNKVNVCAEQIYRAWEQSRFKRGTQLVFCDLSTPKKDFEEYNPDTDFDVYNHVKTTLVGMGIPPEEVAYIHDAESDIAKQILFDNVRSGKIRILIGSTEKCGAGTNVQNKLIAIHHLDTPYRPSDLEQREGRGIRQGNENPEIDIFTYVTERTFDAYSYQILENKQRFISQINRGALTVREAADIDEATLTYSEIKAITSANPLIKRKHEVENELGQLRVLQQQYRNGRYNLQDNIANFLPKAIENTERKIADYEKDIILRDRNSTSEFYMTVNGKPYTERKEAAEHLHKYISNTNAGKKIASLDGFDIIPDFADNLFERTVTVQGNGAYHVTVSDSALGSLTRLENFLKNLEDFKVTASSTLSARQSELAGAKEELEKPFEYEQKILDLSSELAEIDAQLDLNKSEIAPVIDDEKFQSETVEEENDNEDEEPVVYENTNIEKRTRESDYCM